MRTGWARCTTEGELFHLGPICDGGPATDKHEARQEQRVHASPDVDVVAAQEGDEGRNLKSMGHAQPPHVHHKRASASAAHALYVKDAVHTILDGLADKPRQKQSHHADTKVRIAEPEAIRRKDAGLEQKRFRDREGTSAHQSHEHTQQ